MPTWIDDNGEVVASTTFTDAKGRHYIAGIKVPCDVWNEYDRLASRVEELEGMSRTHLAQCRHAKQDYRDTVRELAELVRGAQEVIASEPGADAAAWWEAAESILEGLDAHTWTFTPPLKEEVGCPVTVYDGPYAFQCGKGASIGDCHRHGPFGDWRDPREALDPQEHGSQPDHVCGDDALAAGKQEAADDV